MSTVKISDLPEIPHLNIDTTQSLAIGVDLESGTTGKYTLKTLAEGLYSNDVLNVGNNAVILPNTVAQFAASGGSYVQTNLVNNNDGGTADIVITANANSGGTDSDNFIDMGYANKYYQPGSEFNNIGNAIYPLDGYLYIQGTASSNGGNLVIGTTTSGTNLRFIVGGGTAKNVVAKMTSTGLVLNTQSSITFSDGTVQSTASNPASYSTAAYAQANVTIGVDATQNSRITIIEGVNVGQNTATLATDGKMQTAFDQANNTQNIAQAAFLKANNALANTTGTFAGDLTITGNTLVQKINTASIFVNGTANVSGILNVVGVISGNAQVVLQNTNFLATESALTISATPAVASPSQDGYMLHISGKNGIPSRIITDSYGTGAYGVYSSRVARGTQASPSAVQTGDIIGRYAASGYGTTKYQPFGTGRIDFVAAENYTDANTGSQIQFWNCPVGSNTLTNIATFNGTSAVFTGEVNPQKGLILTPNVLSGITTTLNIDIANNSLYFFKTNATTTINLSNFKTGKIVEVWLTNTDTGGGSNHTITHGCYANNSTLGATSFTLTSLHSAYIKYFSIDGDLANTYCQISYS